MSWKPRLIIAGIVLLAAIIMRAFNVNSFIENIGFMAAGFLFGSVPTSPKP